MTREDLALVILNSDLAMAGLPAATSRENIPGSDGYVVNADDVLAALDRPAASQGEVELGGQDRKFGFDGHQFVNRVSGEPIPLDEPIIIFRGRDRHALAVLRYYLTLATDPHHQAAIGDRIGEFTAYAERHGERMKEPGITRHIALNDDEVTRVAKALFLAEHPGAEWSAGRARAIWFTRAEAAINVLSLTASREGEA